uniref:PRAME nuclear receptor transcriptional regulator n=1 Tax=Suricata suricatta TaxID=37032 RepID=A0A673UA85_SURSU
FPPERWWPDSFQNCTRNPLTLLELAGKSLLRDKDLAIAALETLPAELFPPLFMEAYTRGCNETLKAMVQAWPFARLPLGGLGPIPNQKVLKAVLGGLDLLLAQKVRPR